MTGRRAAWAPITTSGGGEVAPGASGRLANWEDGRGTSGGSVAGGGGPGGVGTWREGATALPIRGSPQPKNLQYVRGRNRPAEGGSAWRRSPVRGAGICCVPGCGCQSCRLPGALLRDRGRVRRTRRAFPGCAWRGLECLGGRGRVGCSRVATSSRAARPDRRPVGRTGRHCCGGDCADPRGRAGADFRSCGCPSGTIGSERVGARDHSRRGEPCGPATTRSREAADRFGAGEFGAPRRRLAEHDRRWSRAPSRSPGSSCTRRSVGGGQIASPRWSSLRSPQPRPGEPFATDAPACDLGADTAGRTIRRRIGTAVGQAQVPDCRSRLGRPWGTVAGTEAPHQLPGRVGRFDCPVRPPSGSPPPL